MKSAKTDVWVSNPRQYYELIKRLANGLINRDEQGTARQRGNGIVEIAGIKIYKSMNLSGSTAPSTAALLFTDPGNTGDFVGVTAEDASNATTGINNDYGTFRTGCCFLWGLIFQREAAGCVGYCTSSGSPLVTCLSSIKVT